VVRQKRFAAFFTLIISQFDTWPVMLRPAYDAAKNLALPADK
jgi:hypothetical protein